MNITATKPISQICCQHEQIDAIGFDLHQHELIPEKGQNLRGGEKQFSTRSEFSFKLHFSLPYFRDSKFYCRAIREKGEGARMKVGSLKGK